MPAPFVMFTKCGIVSAITHFTVLLPIVTFTGFRCAFCLLPHLFCHSSGGSAHIGPPCAQSSPIKPMPLSPTLKHSLSLFPLILHFLNAARSARSAKLEALTRTFCPAVV